MPIKFGKGNGNGNGNGHGKKIPPRQGLTPEEQREFDDLAMKWDRNPPRNPAEKSRMAEEMAEMVLRHPGSWDAEIFFVFRQKSETKVELGAIFADAPFRIHIFQDIDMSTGMGMVGRMPATDEQWSLLPQVEYRSARELLDDGWKPGMVI